MKSTLHSLDVVGRFGGRPAYLIGGRRARSAAQVYYRGPHSGAARVSCQATTTMQAGRANSRVIPVTKASDCGKLTPERHLRHFFWSRRTRCPTPPAGRYRTPGAAACPHARNQHGPHRCAAPPVNRTPVYPPPSMAAWLPRAGSRTANTTCATMRRDVGARAQLHRGRSWPR